MHTQLEMSDVWHLDHVNPLRQEIHPENLLFKHEKRDTSRGHGRVICIHLMCFKSKDDIKTFKTGRKYYGVFDLFLFVVNYSKHIASSQATESDF